MRMARTGRGLGAAEGGGGRSRGIESSRSQEPALLGEPLGVCGGTASERARESERARDGEGGARGTAGSREEREAVRVGERLRENGVS
jgi:hypothetical protein